MRALYFFFATSYIKPALHNSTCVIHTLSAFCAFKSKLCAWFANFNFLASSRGIRPGVCSLSQIIQRSKKIPAKIARASAHSISWCAPRAATETKFGANNYNWEAAAELRERLMCVCDCRRAPIFRSLVAKLLLICAAAAKRNNPQPSAHFFFIFLRASNLGECSLRVWCKEKINKSRRQSGGE